MASTLLACSLVLFWLAGTCYGSVLFSSLERTLIVGASPQEGQMLRVGEDKITVTWSYNQSFPSLTDLAYNKVKLILCYAPISQQDRAWRKTKDELEKDKTCQFDIVERPYNTRDELSFEWTIDRDIPTATYFVRAYAYDAEGRDVGYGQTTDSKKTTNLFEIQGISGRHASIDIATSCFSSFSVLSLVCFFYIEKKKARRAEEAQARTRREGSTQGYQVTELS